MCTRLCRDLEINDRLQWEGSSERRVELPHFISQPSCGLLPGCLGGSDSHLRLGGRAGTHLAEPSSGRLLHGLSWGFSVVLSRRAACRRRPLVRPSAKGPSSVPAGHTCRGSLVAAAFF